MNRGVKEMAIPRTLGMLGNVSISMSWMIIPLFAAALGAYTMMLGVIGMVYGLTYFASSYLFGYLSDLHSRRRYIQTGFLLSSATFLIQAFVTTPMLLLVSRGLCGFTAGMYLPAMIAYVSDTHRPLGRFASFLSLGWALGTFLAGVIAVFQSAFLVSALIFTVGFGISLFLPETDFKAQKLPLFPVNLMKRNMEVYLSYFIRHTGAQTVWIIFPLYLTARGISIYHIGVLYTVNTLTQFAFMQFSDRFGTVELIITGYLGTATTFVVILLSRNYTDLLASQLILGLSWGALYSGSVRYIAERNVEIGTTSGMLQSAISLSGVLGPMLGGALAQRYGYTAPIYFALVAALVAAFTFIAVRSLKGLGLCEGISLEKDGNPTESGGR